MKLFFDSGWTAFNVAIKTSVPPKSTVGYLQTVNGPPTDMSVIYTVLKRSQYLAKRLNLPSVDCVFDQACYAKACQVIWSSPMEFSNVCCRMGAFHTVSVLIAVIFKRFGDAGLIDIHVITESGIIARLMQVGHLLV